MDSRNTSWTGRASVVSLKAPISLGFTSVCGGGGGGGWGGMCVCVWGGGGRSEGEGGGSNH